MMTIIPTRRPWRTSGRLVLAVLLLSLGSSAMLLLTGAETSLAACVASAQ
jgi:hypothetical protein